VLRLVEAFILVRVRPASLDEASNVMKNVKETIAKIRGVKEIKGVFGRYDFIATAEVGTAEQLGTLVTGTIRNIKAVAETETLVVGF
jgi:DNA-binding Lrp family transcriptional regulator